jgi:hypothetical protein
MEHQILVDPDRIYFTHSKISRSFSGCGMKIEDTIEEILDGRLPLESLPQITIIQSKDHLFSLNNRRLFVLKHLRNVGFLASSGHLVKCRLKEAKEREREKYTVEKCSLVASFMGDASVNSCGDAGAVEVKTKMPETITFASLPERARREYKAMLGMAKKGKVKELSAFLQSLLASNDLTIEQLEFVQKELLEN